MIGAQNSALQRAAYDQQLAGMRGGGLLGQLGQAFGGQQGYAPIPEPPPKPILGLDKGEKAKDYLQRKVDGWLSGIELPYNREPRKERASPNNPYTKRGSWIAASDSKPVPYDEYCYRIFGIGSLIFIGWIIWFYS